MKKIYTLFVMLSTAWFSWGQCNFSISASDTVVCPGDTVTLSAAGPSTDLLTTLIAGNNHRGNMFRITAINDVVINAFDAHPMGNTTVEIYYMVGSYIGSENNAAAWTFVGSAPVIAQPLGTATPIPVNVNVMIPAGQTVYASDGNIQFLEGHGMEYPFTAGGGTFSPRIWNGIIHYSPVAGASYLWSTGATTSSTDVTPMSSAYYSVEISSMGCPNYVDSVLINVPSVPVDLGADVDLCAGDSVTLDAGISGATYMWNANPLDSLQTFTVNSTGTFTVEVTDTLGCFSMDQVDVTVHQNPVVDLGPDAIFCVYNTLLLDAGSGFASYDWSNGSSSSSITLDGTTLGIGIYTYTVDVMDNFGCVGSDTITVEVDGCAAVNVLANWGVSVYPNPTTGSVYVNAPVGKRLKLKVFSYEGKLLMESNMTNSGMIDLSSLNEGNYLLEVSSDEFTKIVPLIKQ
jgi:hypothetical protein